jgi:hypothetical protein
MTKIIFQILKENKEAKALHKSIQKRPTERTYIYIANVFVRN